eukprot:TRINITY_DN779909_c0_g1_i1.p1 TRINITY_DN779909_c0_g1~~TRINITY_DN779909_c0_g1_i1.p1  ORF type:complete len:181 (-),score=44.44 TRINITY_DN779909_c0_g1_i1:144-686(-)
MAPRLPQLEKSNENPFKNADGSFELEDFMTLEDYKKMEIAESKEFVRFEDKFAALSKDMDFAKMSDVFKVTKNAAGPHIERVAKAGVFNFHDSGGSIDLLSAEFSTEFSGTYIGATGGVNLVKASAGPFDADIGLSADTGGGIKDDSLQVEALGFGFSVGRKMGISCPLGGFSVDFGKIF